MGNYLTSPNSIKHSQNGALGRFKFGLCAMQGWRISMEDAHLIHYFERLDPANTSAALFGVYDGHGGPQVAQFVCRHLVEELLKNPDFKKGRFDAAFRAAYISLDALLSTEEVQHELELLRGIPGREPIEGSQPSPIGSTSSAEATSLTAAKSSPPILYSSDTPRPGFRSTVKLGGKMFNRRGDKRRKTENETPSSPPNDPEDAFSKLYSTKNSCSGSKEVTACEELLPIGSTICGKPNIDVKSTDDSIEDVDTSDDTHLSSGDSNGGSQPGQQSQQNQQGTKPPQLGATSSQNLFSFSGIRSLFSAMMKLGSSGRTAQVNQGLAMFAGCTAVSVLVTEKQVIVANAGDSRCVICRGNLAVELSKDHKPQLLEERSRIYSAGGWLEMGRVNGNLNLSRAIGDLVYKSNASLPPDRQIVSVVPDVVFADLTEQDEFLIIGCDGIWESSTSQEIVDFIRERIDDVMQLSNVLEVLFEELLSPNPTLFEFGCDNMTGNPTIGINSCFVAIVVDLHPHRRHPRHSSSKHTISSLSSLLDDRGTVTSANTTPAKRNPPIGEVSRVPNKNSSTNPSGSNTSKQEPLLVDRESFWEAHDGSPFATDRSAPTTAIESPISGTDYPTWEGLVASFSASSSEKNILATTNVMSASKDSKKQGKQTIGPAPPPLANLYSLKRHPYTSNSPHISSPGRNMRSNVTIAKRSAPSAGKRKPVVNDAASCGSNSISVTESASVVNHLQSQSAMSANLSSKSPNAPQGSTSTTVLPVLEASTACSSEEIPSVSPLEPVSVVASRKTIDATPNVTAIKVTSPYNAFENRSCKEIVPRQSISNIMSIKNRAQSLEVTDGSDSRPVSILKQPSITHGPAEQPFKKQSQ